MSRRRPAASANASEPRCFCFCLIKNFYSEKNIEPARGCKTIFSERQQGDLIWRFNHACAQRKIITLKNTQVPSNLLLSWHESVTLGMTHYITSELCTEMEAVWPDLAKFSHFGKSLQVFGNFWRFFPYLSNCWSYFGKFATLLGLFSLLQIAKYWKII